MPTLVSNLEIVDDEWTRVVDGGVPAETKVILPLDVWQANRDAGVWIDNDMDIEAIGPNIAQAPLIAVNFPMFADGRGLSAATMLRRHYGFSGELRAFGEVLPDIAVFMHRCGFDSFEFRTDEDAAAAIECIRAMTDHYQSSVREPTPPFKRAAW